MDAVQHQLGQEAVKKIVDSIPGRDVVDVGCGTGIEARQFDPVAGARKAAQVLPPRGRLALFRHVFQLPPAVATVFATVYRRVVPDSPFTLRPAAPAMDMYQVMFADATTGIREVGGFSEPEQWRFDRKRHYTRDEWLDQLPTQGSLTRLPPDQPAEVLAGVGTAIDAVGGSFTMPFATVVVTAQTT